MLAFLNNDLEVLEGSWLEALVRHAIRPGVGAVEAKLLDPDGFVQHAGVVIDAKGNPDHAYRLYPGDHPGPERRLLTTQRCLAVTGACMVMLREAFERALATAGRTGRPPLTDLRVDAAEALVRVARTPDAEQLLSAELSAFPANVRARAALQALYRASGRSQDAAALAQH